MTTDLLEPSLNRSLVPDEHAPAVARRALARFDGEMDEDLRERSRLVLTEMVTNSVRHAGLTPSQPIDLKITLQPDVLRMDLTDDGPGFGPAPIEPAPGQAAAAGACGWCLSSRTAGASTSATAPACGASSTSEHL